MKQTKPRSETKCLTTIHLFLMSIFHTGLNLKKIWFKFIPNARILLLQTKIFQCLSNYVVGPGDSLKIQSWGAVDGDTNAKSQL